LNIIKQLITDNEYYRDECKKTQIVLHHRVSSKGYGKNVRETFTSDKGKSKVAVPYVIDADGTIYELFAPKYWAYHLGIKDVGNASLCKKSIAIELVNEGQIEFKNGKNMWTFGEYKGKVVDYKWRGFEHWADYPDTQMNALVELVNKLCKEFNIPKSVFMSYDFDLKAQNHNGIISHCNVRKDKTDISPAFSLAEFQKKLNFVNA
jgi:N-acetyl-anhydromuramyl-L-alanine amidase AmpD